MSKIDERLMEGNPAKPGLVRSFLTGMQSVSGFAIITFVFGIIFSVAAISMGLEKYHALLMSALVFTATVQFAALEIWQEPIPLATLLISTVLISARHILLGLALVRHFEDRSLVLRLLSMAFLTDPNTILTMQISQSKAPLMDRMAYFVGGGAILYISWIVGTVFGLTFTNLFSTEQLEALKYSGVLVMATMMVIIARGSRDGFLPWVVSGLLAIVLNLLGLHPYLVVPVAVTAGAVVCHLRMKSQS